VWYHRIRIEQMTSLLAVKDAEEGLVLESFLRDLKPQKGSETVLRSLREGTLKFELGRALGGVLAQLGDEGQSKALLVTASQRHPIL
jgi:hypothetical protein